MITLLAKVLYVSVTKAKDLVLLRKNTQPILRIKLFNPLTPKLNPSAQRCLTRCSTGDFASSTVYFVNICVKIQQMQQLFIQVINYVWYLLHVSALHCHLQGAFLVPSERCSIEEHNILSTAPQMSKYFC
jgi:hypothetical protein